MEPKVTLVSATRTHRVAAVMICGSYGSAENAAAAVKSVVGSSLDGVDSVQRVEVFILSQ